MYRYYMRIFFTTIVFLFLSFNTYSQELSQVTFSGGTRLTSIAFLADREVLIRISEEGKILEWGIEWQAMRSDYYAPKLQPYIGRVEFYGPEADSVNRGKVKSIGTCMFTYYGPFEMDIKVGKLKSIGRVFLDYYTNYDNVNLKGKLKYIGDRQLEYYSSFENEAYRGKLKAIGSSFITYYSSFDDKFIKGKVKSIASVKFLWYTSLDRLGYGGGLKSGLYRQHISGITYILQ